jgi:2-polyprenyl-3-methyl-5-hydroxy-6-metoxy-1,4-benzoquinol methylase
MPTVSVAGEFVAEVRRRQDAYSDQQPLMLDEANRTQKAKKIAAIVEHFLGRTDLTNLKVLDIGCSGGIVASVLQSHGADVVGVDIDVPGVTRGQAMVGNRVAFVLADAEGLPFRDHCFDVVVCNHVYEHVVDPGALFADLRRVLGPDGVAYLGLANRLKVIEPHYRLPFLSWLPRGLAHRYVRATGRAPHYHERLVTRRGLKRLCHDFEVWDYSRAVIASPERFDAEDAVSNTVASLPNWVVRLARPLFPTYFWIATAHPSRPSGDSLRVPPENVRTPRRDALPR